MDNIWKVYILTNTVNNKRYIGITSRDDPNDRWKNGKGYPENSHLRSAINLYGWDNFSKDVVCNNLSESDAKATEVILIASLRTKNNKFGYNMTDGGDGTKGVHPSEETRKKLSNARRRENLSAETLMRRSEGLRGRKFSDEHKKKIGESNSKPVVQMSICDEYINTFKSAREAELTLGISHSHISQCCHGKRQTAGGSKWKFA